MNRYMIVAIAAAIAVMPLEAFGQRRGFSMGIEGNFNLNDILMETSAILNDGGKLCRFPISLRFEGRIDGNGHTLQRSLQHIKAIMPSVQQKGATLVVCFFEPNRGNEGFPVIDANQFVQDWRVIASALKDYPSNSIWFELGNEQIDIPNRSWRSLATRAALEIRKVDSKHPICYSPTGTVTTPALTIQKLDVAGPQLLTFHAWNWMTRWPDVQQDKGAIVAYPSAGRTKEDLDRLLTSVAEAGVRNGVPVFISEVGIRTDHPNIGRFARDFTSKCDALGISVAWHGHVGPPWGIKSSTNGWSEIQKWLAKP